MPSSTPSLQPTEVLSSPPDAFTTPEVLGQTNQEAGIQKPEEKNPIDLKAFAVAFALVGSGLAIIAGYLTWQARDTWRIRQEQLQKKREQDIL